MMLGVVAVRGRGRENGERGEGSDIESCGCRGVVGQACVLQATTAVASAVRRPIRSAHRDVHAVGGHLQQCDGDEHWCSEGCAVCFCKVRVGGDMLGAEGTLRHRFSLGVPSSGWLLASTDESPIVGVDTSAAVEIQYLSRDSIRWSQHWAQPIV